MCVSVCLSVCLCLCKNRRESWPCRSCGVVSARARGFMPCHALCARVCSLTAWQAACPTPPHRPVSRSPSLTHPPLFRLPVSLSLSFGLLDLPWARHHLCDLCSQGLCIPPPPYPLSRPAPAPLKHLPYFSLWGRLEASLPLQAALAPGSGGAFRGPGGRWEGWGREADRAQRGLGRGGGWSSPREPMTAWGSLPGIQGPRA